MRILLVCLGNICRSPVAEAALRAELEAAGLGDDVVVESAGTGDWHVGDPPDPRMVSAAATVGLTMDGRAQQVTADDLADYDLILTMDRSNLADVRAMAPDDATRDRVHLFAEFADAGVDEVPDPYYGGPDGFERVVALVTDAARAITRRLAEGRDALRP